MIRVFPRRTSMSPTDGLAFFDSPGLFRPPPQPVRVSCTFTWDMEKAEELAKDWAQYYDDVQIGGPAYGDPGGEFVPSRFTKLGTLITSRGCPNRCDFCFVPSREGAIRELTIQRGWNVADNSLLACSDNHVEAVFKKLRLQGDRVTFSGGLDTTMLTDRHVELLRGVKLDQAFFAADGDYAMEALWEAGLKLKGISINKLRCYVLMDPRKETLAKAHQRALDVLEMGFLPFAQLYQPTIKKTWAKEWRDLARHWSRPAIYKSTLATA